MKVSKSASENNGKFQQFVSAIIVNLATISFGIACGWPSPVIPQLRSSRSPIGDGPASEDEISWIVSIAAIGGLTTIPFCAGLSERIGRKKFAISSGLPHIVSWLLIIFGWNFVCLHLARLIGGAAVAMTCFIVPVYTSEIATEDIRGMLGSFFLLSINIGILLAYVAGAFLSYRTFASVSLVFPILFVVGMLFIPETPVYLVRRNRHDEARKSLMFFRGNNRALVEQELTQLKSQATAITNGSKSVRLSEFFRDRATRKGLIVSMGMIAAQQLSGIVAVTNYAQTIFKLAGSSLSSELSSITIAVIQIVGSQASTMLMERAGRRLLSLASCLGMAASLAIVATFFHLQRNDYDVSSCAWLPLVALSAYIVTYCLGIGPVPFVVIAEVFDLNVSGLATTLCFVFFFAVGFAGIKLFDLTMRTRGADGCFFMLAAIAVASFFFCYYLLPETKGRKREDIVHELAGLDKSCDKSNESKLLDNNAESA